MIAFVDITKELSFQQRNSIPSPDFGIQFGKSEYPIDFCYYSTESVSSFKIIRIDSLGNEVETINLSTSLITYSSFTHSCSGLIAYGSSLECGFYYYLVNEKYQSETFKIITVLDGVSTNLIKFGALYNGYVVSLDIAPSGWHLPSESEFNTLISELGGGTLAGPKMRDSNPIYWGGQNTDISNAGGCINTSGFSMRGSGQRTSTIFSYNGQYNAIWNTTTSGVNLGIIATWWSYAQDISVTYSSKKSGHTIRFIKNSSDWTLGETVKDYDGNIYNTIKIGSQVWTVENFGGTKTSSGATIPLIQNQTAWGLSTSGAMCFFDNNPAYAYDEIENVYLSGLIFNRVESDIQSYFKNRTFLKFGLPCYPNTRKPNFEYKSILPVTNPYICEVDNKGQLLNCTTSYDITSTGTSHVCTGELGVLHQPFKTGWYYFSVGNIYVSEFFQVVELTKVLITNISLTPSIIGAGESTTLQFDAKLTGLEISYNVEFRISFDLGIDDIIFTESLTVTYKTISKVINVPENVCGLMNVYIYNNLTCNVYKIPINIECNCLEFVSLGIIELVGIDDCLELVYT